MIKLVHQFTHNEPVRIAHYIDPNPTDKNNPTTVIKYYDRNGALSRVVMYDESCDVVHNFSYNKNSFSRMTDLVTGKNCKPKNINKFMGIELPD